MAAVSAGPGQEINRDTDGGATTVQHRTRDTQGSAGSGRLVWETAAVHEAAHTQLSLFHHFGHKLWFRGGKKKPPTRIDFQRLDAGSP